MASQSIIAYLLGKSGPHVSLCSYLVSRIQRQQLAPHQVTIPHITHLEPFFLLAKLH